MELKDVLQKLREEQGWNLTQAAKRVGMDRVRYSRLEKGEPKRPQYETLVRIAEGFGVSPVTLIEATGQTIMESAGRYMADVESDELIQLFDRLSDDDRIRLIAIARAFYQLRKD